MQTGVKSLGWEKRIAQPSPIQSWKLMVPRVVSAVKSGASSPICSDMILDLVMLSLELSQAGYSPPFDADSPVPTHGEISTAPRRAVRDRAICAVDLPAPISPGSPKISPRPATRQGTSSKRGTTAACA